MFWKTKKLYISSHKVIDSAKEYIYGNTDFPQSDGSKNTNTRKKSSQSDFDGKFSKPILALIKYTSFDHHNDCT